MKQVILLLSMFVGGVGFSQGTITEKKEFTENGMTRGWVITKQVDMRGVVTSYDSTYYERPASQSEFTPYEFGEFGSTMPEMNISKYDFGDSEIPDFSTMTEFEDMTKAMMDMTKSMFVMTDSLMSMFMGPNRLPQMDRFEDYYEGLDTNFSQ